MPSRLGRYRRTLRPVVKRKKEMFFFEKKNQKTFVCWVPRTLKQNPSGRDSARAKVFCLFYSKNKHFFAFGERSGQHA
jgi:hypothetical protein